MSIKGFIKSRLSSQTLTKLRGVRSKVNLQKVFLFDRAMFRRHSSTFSNAEQEQLEFKLILSYHGIEKGFLHLDKLRFKFRKEGIIEMQSTLKQYLEKGYPITSQVNYTLSALCAYYELHKHNNIDISDYYKESDYLKYKRLGTQGNPYVRISKEELFASNQANFLDFCKSRHSIRQFDTQRVSISEIEQVIELANHAPSACNRQETRVHFVNDAETTQEILKLQGGFSGLSNEIYQLLVLTGKLSYTYMVEERMQIYVDGGIYLQNLLFALHYYKIGACPGHADVSPEKEKKILSLAKADSNERLISIIVIGNVKNDNITTASERRPINETLSIING